MAQALKYLVFGNGYVGQYLHTYLAPNSVLVLDRVHTQELVENLLDQLKPQVVINCIGKTGTPNVDWCEHNKEETYKSNVIVPLVLSNACLKKGVRFINIGTGCVFNGGEFFDESIPNYFGSFYSRTKLMAEDLLSERGDTTLRIRLLISDNSSPKNFLSKLYRYSKVTDIYNSVTFLKDLGNAIQWVVDKDLHGTINVTHPLYTSAKQISEMIGWDKEIVTQEELGVGNRANCVLHPRRLVNSGFDFVDFQEELQLCVEEVTK